MANLKIAKDWLGLANTDLVGAKALFEIGDKFFALSAFHAQQAAEKALKGYLVYNSIRAPKSHDVADLLALIGTKDPELAILLKSCEELTNYAVAYRYPDAQKKSLSKNMVEEAIIQAELALKECIRRIK